MATGYTAPNAEREIMKAYEGWQATKDIACDIFAAQYTLAHNVWHRIKWYRQQVPSHRRLRVYLPGATIEDVRDIRHGKFFDKAAAKIARETDDKRRRTNS
jgi:hypothetical protein